jgi:drug/metabolite transporter (DMT)-like permease
MARWRWQKCRSLLSARLALDTVIAVFFAILSSACFGTGDYVGGIAAKRADLIFLMLANQIAGSLSLLLVASLLTPFQLPGGDLILAALAGASTAIGIPLLYRALAIGPMSIAAPVTALMAILLPVIYGISFLGEMPTWLAVAGFALAGVAVFLLGGGDKILEVFKPASGASSNALRGFLYALGAGTCIATFYVAIKRCSPESGLWPLVAARAVALGAVGGVAWAISPAGFCCRAQGSRASGSCPACSTVSATPFTCWRPMAGISALSPPSPRFIPRPRSCWPATSSVSGFRRPRQSA